ncbi:MAG: glycosyltransferase family 4 protein [Desulfovibrionaceae bacterium]
MSSTDARHTVLFLELGTMGGGSFQSLYELLGAFDPQRVRPIVVFVNRTRYLDMVRDMGVQVHLVRDLAYSLETPKFLRRRFEKLADRGPLRMPSLARPLLRFVHGSLINALVRIIRDENVDLLYLNGQINRALPALLAVEATGVPCVCHLRSKDGTTFEGVKRELARKNVGAYISICKANYDYWTERGIPLQGHFIIHNGMPDFDVEPLDLTEFGIPAGAVTVGCVSRLIPEKGHEFLLQGFAELASSREDAWCLMIGDGPMEERLRTMARELGVAERVVFTGYESRAKEIMASLNCLAQLSSTDPFGRTVPEAMRLNCPVVASDRGGIREVIRPEENGLLVTYGDIKALASALERAMYDRELAARLTAAGSETVRNSLSIHSKASRILEIMLALIQGEKPVVSYPGEF